MTVGTTTADCTCDYGEWTDEDNVLHEEFTPDFDCVACNWRGKLGDDLIAKIKQQRAYDGHAVQRP